MKNKAASNRKTQQVLSSIWLENVELYLRDEPVSSDVGIVQLHPTNELDGLHTETKIILIHIVVDLQINYLNLLKNETNIVSFHNTKYKV